MHTNITQPTAVTFLRARSLGPEGRDHQQEQQMIAAQRATCQQAAETLGAHIIREYVEYGGTGHIDARSVVRLMLDELRALQDTDYVIVTSPERLTRRSHDTAVIALELEAAGAELVTATNVMRTEDREEIAV